ncbi:uncharacterized protein LOC128884184 isoform X1 [Hylaeus volcanicus]|uniref:uncharacterized protein LOC128884184 isoform X1 n=1 Tax=Hylaeus volcanicus TaxID=313075 RepID=UPI0023B7AC4B|nr:uncharacterized protein LOC128884184 isoform X1 [Hylaeus volcanicus]XP_053993314.1 uncharacterized protein LOC128884184 isoform X1 [Hylaeus volcanicus]XP_053993316.1 uncharacterized protein LOC128884184 isoform X1 [Hylaeus volcanicus]
MSSYRKNDHSFDRINAKSAVVSLMGSPYRLASNPFTPSYHINSRDPDCTLLHQAPFPYGIPNNTQPYNILCTSLLRTDFSRNKSYFTDVNWFPDAQRFLSTSLTGEIVIWNSETLAIEDFKRLPASSGGLTCCEWLPDNSMALFGDMGGHIILTNDCLSPLGILMNEVQHPILCLTPSPTSLKICSASKHNFPCIFDLKTQSKERDLAASGYEIICLQWHPSKGLIATGSKTNQLVFWDPRSAAAIKIVMAHNGSLTCLQFNSEGTLLATSGRDTLLRIWDMRTMNCLSVLRPTDQSDSFITKLAWHPLYDSQILISGDASGRLITNDLNSKFPKNALDNKLNFTQCCSLKIPMFHEQQITGISFHPLAHLLCTTGFDGSIKIWGPTVEKYGNE